MNTENIASIKNLALILGGISLLWLVMPTDGKNAVSDPVQIMDQPAPSERIASTMLACSEQGSRSSCYQDAAKDFLKFYSLREILGVFQANEAKPEFFMRCHQTAHFLGQERYHQLKDVKQVFVEATSACLGGVYHGTIEGYFIDNGILLDGEHFDKAGPAAATVCAKPEDYEIPQHFIECLHGLGHAVMFITDDDLLEALKLCDNLDNQENRELCYSGALMQNFDERAVLDHPSKYVKADDLYYPCPILEKQYQNQCYSYGVLVRTQSDVQKSIAVCAGVPSDYQLACFQTIGRDQTILTADVEDLKNRCDLFPTNFRRDCVAGVGYNLVVRFGLESSLAAQFCSLGTTHQESCFASVFSALQKQTRNDQQLERFCRKIEDNEYRELCLKSRS